MLESVFDSDGQNEGLMAKALMVVAFALYVYMYSCLLNKCTGIKYACLHLQVIISTFGRTSTYRSPDSTLPESVLATSQWVIVGARVVSADVTARRTLNGSSVVLEAREAGKTPAVRTVTFYTTSCSD